MEEEEEQGRFGTSLTKAQFDAMYNDWLVSSEIHNLLTMKYPIQFGNTQRIITYSLN